MRAEPLVLLGLMLVLARCVPEAHAEPFLYVAGPPDYDPVYGGHRILTVVDSATDTVVGTAVYGTGQPVAATHVAVSPSGRYVYVTNDGGVDEVDASTNMELRFVGFPYGGGGNAGLVAGPASPTSRPVYAGGGQIGLFDLASRTVTALTPPDTSTQTLSLAIDRTGNRLYASDVFANVVNVIDVATASFVSSIPVGFSPDDIALNSMGTRAYVACIGPGEIDVIDTTIMTVITTIPMGPTNNVRHVVVHPLGTFVYATNTCPVAGCDGYVSVIDAATNLIVTTIPVGFAPSELAITPDGTKLYVVTGCENSAYPCPTGSIAVVDTSTNQVVHSIPINDAAGLALVPPSCAQLPDGTPCNDETGNICATDTCQAGVCVATPLPDGIPCDDGDACTQADSCQGGACAGADPVVCPTIDSCQSTTCEPATGTCSITTTLPDATPCTDGVSCPEGSYCQGGACSCTGPLVGLTGGWQTRRRSGRTFRPSSRRSWKT